MFQTLKISHIKDKWRDALANSTAIEDFCRSNYNKSPNIYVGLNKKQRPKKDNYPLIIIRPGTKIEGPGDLKNKYAISIGWGIVNDNTVENGNVIELEGIDECDELGQLIISELFDVNPSYPITEMEYDIEPVEFFPQIVGNAVLQLEIQPTIGAQLDY